MAEMKIYLLGNESIVEVLNALMLCCEDRRRAVPCINPISWAAKLTIAEAADVLDAGIDVNEFIVNQHDPHGLIRSKLENHTIQ